MNPLAVSALSILMFVALYMATVISLKVIAIQAQDTNAGKALAFVTF